MFSKSPYRHIPFFPQTPAGFRMLNPSKKPYFRPSIFSRHPSPCVDSPSSSPTCEPDVPAFFDCNAPPTQGLPHIFQPASANTARVGRPPTKAAVPKPKVFKKSVPTKAFPSQIIHPRRKLWHKRFTYHLTVTRPDLCRKGPRFCNPAKLRREKAAAAPNNLENVALKTMQTGGMTAEDRIFLKQLEELRLDQLRRHMLGDAREVVAHAEALGSQRELEHAERNRQAALRLEENAQRKKEEEEFRRLEELRRLEEERRWLEEEKRRQEEGRRRQEEARRHAEERARLREQRERELQAKREAFRKAQEEAEHRARVQAEQHLREEARWQERQRQEALHRNKARAGLVAFFQLYDTKWKELKLSQKLTSVMLCEMPWPTFQQGCASPDDISRRSMEEFIFHPLRPGMETKSRKDRLKVEILRFHPNKFNSNIVRKLRECDRERASKIAGALARILTNMMAEEIQKETDQ
ncbi:uncharacterized protein BJ212DRAFT_1399924 [Suillus subaureus]|uniref:Uncharacterized protein n=1 Tax=Suillus subaureus TaxID=48587 RepID=A0A9P7DR59_9AGAM|nr:uncharacterized protein BJ212DRAFT_1399924 [Suillus subaureus]KAG1801095.1 hypothetical protein BJ212DRAFT_1399924 [Suillus subaureus]